MSNHSHPASGEGRERRKVSRRGFLGMTTAAGLAASGALPGVAGASAATGATAAVTTPTGTAPFRTSLSVSPETERVLAQTSLTDGTRTARTPEELQRLYMAHGATEVYARMATRRFARDKDAEHGFHRAIERAFLARKLGLPLNVELGLWNVYGDVSHQPGPDFSDYPLIRLPGPWESLTLNQMSHALRLYGAIAAGQILATGVKVNVWDIGNEVEFGVAGVAPRGFTPSTDYWTYAAPDAVDPAIGQMQVYTLLLEMSDSDRISWLRTHLWPYTGRLLAAVAEGVRLVAPQARFSSHTSVIAMQYPGFAEAFWQAMADAGFPAHQLGTSYYPTSVQYGDQLAAFKNSSQSLHSTFGKQVFIAEAGYPSGTMGPPLEWNTPVSGYPLSTQGQYEFHRDIVAWGAQNGCLAGIRPWAPDSCVGFWQPMSHFTPSGGSAAAKPVLDAIAHGLQ
ncbi:glycosyl hydrolase 53 family protein [Yinghuangia sp. YIM S09857]|uniref:glycosyl hydrolase 53 family protein n=1 Tax=Yinghuangia sp. YIM S09857 TaxID=3436929 RepID=UPI003F53C4B3